MYASKLNMLILLAVSIGTLNAQTRTEKDLLGEKQIPAEAYYGVQTLRALENFQVSGVKTNFYPVHLRLECRDRHWAWC